MANRRNYSRRSHKGLAAFCVVLALIVAAACTLGGMQLFAPEGKKIKPSEWFEKDEELAEISIRMSYANENFAVPVATTRATNGIGTKTATATCHLADGGIPDRYQWAVMLDGEPDDGEYFAVVPQNDRADTIQITALKYFPGIAHLTATGYRGDKLEAEGKVSLLFDKSVCPTLQVVYLTDGSALYQEQIQVLRDYDEASENCRICWTPFTTIEEYFKTRNDLAYEFFGCDYYFEFTVICDEQFRLFDLFDANRKTHSTFKDYYGYITELGECSDADHRNEVDLTSDAQEIQNYWSFSPVEDYSYILEDYLNQLYDQLGESTTLTCAYDDPNGNEGDGFFEDLLYAYGDNYLYVSDFTDISETTYLNKVQLLYLRDEYSFKSAYNTIRRSGYDPANYFWFLPDVHDNDIRVKELIKSGATVLAFRKAMDIGAIYKWIETAPDGAYTYTGLQLYNSVERIT